MYENAEKGYLSFNSDIPFCFACLSSNRNLFCIDENADILYKIVNNSLPVSPDVLLCWECIAILKTIKLFKSRVEKAQTIISNYFMQKQKSLLRSLSTLSSKTSKVEDVIHMAHDDNYEQKATTIKHEIRESEDEIIYFEMDNVSDRSLKNEIKSSIKNKLSNDRRSHYRIVYGPDIFKKSLLRKKFSIKPEAIPLWLEKEKDSQFYKKFRFRCNKCYEGNHSKEKLDKHYLECHDEGLGPHVCGTCNARFSSPRSLEAHAQEHLRAWSCARCHFESYSRRRLNAHFEHSHKLVQCLYCDLCLPNVRQFREHYRAMHSVFQCDHCGKGCKTKYMLEKHMSSHGGTHVCVTCSRTYATRASLRKHTAHAHAAGAPELAYCVRCDKQFASAPIYRRHLLNATAHAHETDRLSKKRISCPECENTYSRRAYMMNHYRHVHERRSKHVCAHCDRHFLNRTRYVEHMRYNHEGAKKEKNKLCNVCGRGFATNRTLVNHIRTHSGERPYECAHCPARFTQKHSMQSHVKYIHLKNKRRAPWQTNNIQ